VLTRPPEPCEVWREQAFEVMLDGKWITGIFDRVAVFRDEAGRPVRAEIIDYKTNRVDQAEQIETLTGHYRPQMETYRHALSKLLNVSPDNIRARLIFTDAGRVAGW
jgi:ATP-dependent exoDNAse (exonuclease V) beta subunit